MNARFWELTRAVRGPIMLITFGILMALNHMDQIGFERTWPVLIIVYGCFGWRKEPPARPLRRRTRRPAIRLLRIHAQYPPQGGAQ